MKLWKFFAILLILLTAGLGIGIAMVDSFPPMPVALEALRATDNVTVGERKLA